MLHTHREKNWSEWKISKENGYEIVVHLHCMHMNGEAMKAEQEESEWTENNMKKHIMKL